VIDPIGLALDHFDDGAWRINRAPVTARASSTTVRRSTARAARSNLKRSTARDALHGNADGLTPSAAAWVLRHAGDSRIVHKAAPGLPDGRPDDSGQQSGVPHRAEPIDESKKQYLTTKCTKGTKKA
jgi:hypothetical protein